MKAITMFAFLVESAWNDKESLDSLIHSKGVLTPWGCFTYTRACTCTGSFFRRRTGSVKESTTELKRIPRVNLAEMCFCFRTVLEQLLSVLIFTSVGSSYVNKAPLESMVNQAS